MITSFWLRILLVVLGAGCIGGAYVIKVHQLDAALLEVATLKAEIAQANTEAANKAAALQSAVTKAQNDAKTREITLRAAAAAATSESDGLRNDLSAAHRQLSSLTADAASQRAAAIEAVLVQCSREYQGLAAKADRHANDVRTLIEAWPK